MEAENASPAPKESTKPEESPCPAAESEAKMEEKVIEAPVIQEEEEDLKKTTNADEKPKGVSTEPVEEKTKDKPVEPPLPPPTEEDCKTEVAESKEAKVDDKLVELPPTLNEKKTEDAPPTVDAPDKCTPEVADEAVLTPDTACVVAEPTIAKTGIKSEPEDTNVEPIEKKLEETEKVVNVPESAPAEVIEEKEETPIEFSAKEVEAIEDKDVAVPEAESRPKETYESAPLVEEKPREQIEKETPEPEPLEKVEVESPADKLEDTTKLPEKEETCPIESSDEVKPEAPVTQVEEKHVESNPIGEGNEVTERAKEALDVTGLTDEKAVESGKNETETAAPPEEKSVVAEELVQYEEKPTEDAEGSVPQTELAEKVAQDEATSKDIELVCDEGNNKDEPVASAATANEEELVKGEKETTKESEKKEEAEKTEQIVQATEAKLEEVKQVDEKIEETPQATEEKEEEKQFNEPVKTDVQNPECNKESEDTKTYQDVRKEDVPVKKQSFVKIMKQSLVKAKKAIVGKSQNPKTPASEPKDDGNK